MNRQFKFRVWSGYFEKFFDLEGGYTWFSKKDMGYDTEDLSYTGNIVIQQFTGLKDKNGKEIYEGDIVTGKDYSKGKIVYCEKTAKFLISFDLNKDKINPDNSLMFSNGGDSNPRSKKFKIIGNIFENSELLK